MSLRIVRFDKKIHERSAFSCGMQALDEFLKKRASQHLKRGVCTVHVLVDELNRTRVLGYYTLSSAQIARTDLAEGGAKRLPLHPIPTIVIGRLAVHQDEQGKGHGGLLLIDAIQRCARVSQEVGVHAIVVDAKNNKAKAFYEHFGFVGLPQHPLRLILALGTALRLVSE